MKNFLSRDGFKVYNDGKDIKQIFEDLCIDYFVKKYQLVKDDIIIIEPNNIWIETQPINNGLIGVQAKFVPNTTAFNSQIKNSLTKDKLKNYKKIKKIVAIWNVDFEIKAKTRKNQIIANKGRKIKIKYINWKTFLRELERPEFYDLQYNYFWKNDIWWFLKNQQVKYVEYAKYGINKNAMMLYEDVSWKKITVSNFLDNYLLDFSKNTPIVIMWAPASGKSLLFTHYIDALASKYTANKVLPICLNLIKRDGSGLINYINRNLNDFRLDDFAGHLKTIIFVDGRNEISSGKCELLLNELEFINSHCKNVLKIVLSTRTGSIKNSILNPLFEKFFLKSTYTFEIEEYLQKAFKNIEDLSILNPKRDNFNNFLWIVALKSNFYDENISLNLNDLQNNCKESLWLLLNVEVNEVVDFAVDTNIVYKANYWGIVFSDQKIYEYFFVNYIANHFFEEISRLRSYNFFYKTTMVESLVNMLEYSFREKSLADIIVKNLFIDRIYHSSWDNNWWWFEFDNLLLKALLIQKGLDIYINENKYIKSILYNNYLDPKTIFELKKVWNRNEALHMNKIFKEDRKAKLANWFSWIKLNKTEDNYAINKERENLEMNQFYKNYSYFLIDNLRRAPSIIKSHYESKRGDIQLWSEIILFLIYLLEKDLIKTFTKCIWEIKSNDFYRRFNQEITKIKNIYLYKKIPYQVFSKLVSVYSFKKLVSNLSEITRLYADRYDSQISWILMLLLYSRAFNFPISKSKVTIIKSIIYQDGTFFDIGYLSDGDIVTETKVITIAALLDWEERKVYPKSNKYGGKYTKPKIRTLVWLIYWFIWRIDWINKDEFIDVYLVFYNLWNELDYRNSNIEWVHLNILSWIIQHLIQVDDFSESFFRIIIQKWFSSDLIVEVLEKIINETDSKCFHYSIIELLEKDIGNYSHYSDNYKKLLILSYISWLLDKTGNAILYFEKALNHTYIRYGWRKDYYFDYVIDVLEEWCKKWYITSDELYEHCIKIWGIYNQLIKHVDGKWTRQIPALLIAALGEYAPEKVNNIKSKFTEREGWWFSLIWSFSALLKRIENYDNANNILLEIDSLRVNYIRYNKEVKVIELILLARMNNKWYYKNWEESVRIKHKMKEVVDGVQEIFKSFGELKSEVDHLNRSTLDADLFILDLKEAILEYNFWLEWSVEDLTKKYVGTWLNSFSPIDLDFDNDATYEEILENYHNYNISELLNKEIEYILKQFKSKFPADYMRKIMNSSLFRSVCWTMYAFYWNDFSLRFWISIYELNPSEFKNCINKELSSKYWNYYFTNITLIAKIIAKENNKEDYRKLIDNLWGLTDLLCL